MFYKYKVGWYDSYKDEETYSNGIVYAHDWGTAANHVVNDYGKDTVFDLNLREIAMDSDGYCLSEDEITYAFKENK